MATFEPLEEGDVLTELGGKPYLNEGAMAQAQQAAAPVLLLQKLKSLNRWKSASMKNYRKNASKHVNKNRKLAALSRAVGGSKIRRGQ